jgi:glutamate---cysteine ligase / carboxylate-amine ligase
MVVDPAGEVSTARHVSGTGEGYAALDVGATVGVEEEFHIVDPRTGDLVPAARRVLRRTAGQAESELQRSIVETASAVHADLASLRRDLVARRRRLAEAAAGVGLAVATVGTVPASGTHRGRVFPEPRYEWMAAEYQQLVDEQQVCACQVHVSVADRDLAVRITRRIRGWLPVLLAMSASSPYFQGEDTGYASYRNIVVSRWPTVGPPPDFESAAEYDQTVASLVHSGVIVDAGMVYFDARLSARYPTIEVRVADGCPSVDDAVLLAALCRALVVIAARTGDETTVPSSPQVLLRAAMWRAARSGLDGLLVDPLTFRAVPAPDMVRALLEHLRPVLQERGEWDEVAALAGALLARGTSARRQREAMRRGRSKATVVAELVAETATG